MNSPAGYIEEEIRRAGTISCARFMELALYAPGGGYYEQRREPGRRGDFFTSVSVGPVFGELLAFQIAEWLATMPSPTGKWQVVEAGAHEGQLALDILRWWRKWRPALLEKVDYVLLEPSAIRRAWQREKLGSEFNNVRWVAAMGTRVNGVIFSNELLDAMPVHRLGWDAARRRWIEWRVGLNADGLAWQKEEPAADLTGYLPVIPPELAEVLPEGYLTEVSPAALRWWREAAENLAHGKLLTLDYGFDAKHWLQPERRDGTLRAYRAHRITGDILATPGGQDITAHVNFGAVRATGEEAGLRTVAWKNQSSFLTGIFALAQSKAMGLGEWTTSQVKQFQTLTHPEHLGHRFHALVQSR